MLLCQIGTRDLIFYISVGFRILKRRIALAPIRSSWPQRTSRLSRLNSGDVLLHFEPVSMDSRLGWDQWFRSPARCKASPLEWTRFDPLPSELLQLLLLLLYLTCHLLYLFVCVSYLHINSFRLCLVARKLDFLGRNSRIYLLLNFKQALTVFIDRIFNFWVYFHRICLFFFCLKVVVVRCF